MELKVNWTKVFGVMWPVYALVALSVVLTPDKWRLDNPSVWTLALILGAWPVLVWLVRDRWKLEITSDALLHHTLTRVERFEWRRMGPVETHWQHVLHLPLMKTLWFHFPTDAPHGFDEQITARIGRRLLPVFGDRSLRETAELLESWRKLAQASGPIT